MRRTLISGLLVPAVVAVAPVGVLAAARAKSAVAPKSPAPVTLLLTRADLGKGWSVELPAPAKVPAVACSALHVKLRGAAAHPASAASPTFRQSSSGPFVAQTAYEYPERFQQRQVWRAIARRGLLTCLAESFVNGSTAGVHFTVTSKRTLLAPRLGPKAAAYRVQATATRGSQSVNAYLDVILLANATGLSELSLSSLVGPPSPALERRLVRVVASSMQLL